MVRKSPARTQFTLDCNCVQFRKISFASRVHKNKLDSHKRPRIIHEQTSLLILYSPRNIVDCVRNDQNPDLTKLLSFVK